MSVLMPTYNRFPVTFSRGEGSYLYTGDGERFLDFGAGIAVNAFGHTHPRLVAALSAQAERLWHTSNLYHIEDQERLGQRLVDKSFADLAFFANSGAEAIEAAIKTVRKYFAVHNAPERFRLITFEGAFHGRTLATIAAGGQAKHLDGFGPKVDGFDQVPLNDISAVKSAIGPETAGILIEPIQGEGGIRIAHPQFLQDLRALCDETGLLLIFDEIQTGMGRTGTLFAHQQMGVTPDLMCLAKGLGGGFPIGACLATHAAGAGMTAGVHGTTFGGNPLAMAVANAVMDLLDEPGFLTHVQNMGALLKQELLAICREHGDVISETRGQGLMIGLKCQVPNGNLVQALFDERLLAVGAGDNVVRLLPPLTLDEVEINEAASAIAMACDELESRPLREFA